MVERDIHNGYGRSFFQGGFIHILTGAKEREVRTRFAHQRDNPAFLGVGLCQLQRLAQIYHTVLARHGGVRGQFHITGQRSGEIIRGRSVTTDVYQRSGGLDVVPVKQRIESGFFGCAGVFAESFHDHVQRAFVAGSCQRCIVEVALACSGIEQSAR